MKNTARLCSHFTHGKENDVQEKKGVNAIYPGTFDPITNGHVDIIERARRIFDRLLVAVAEDSGKSTVFDAQERMELIKKVIEPQADIEVQIFKGLLVDFAARNNCFVIIRGIRAISDYEYEFQMAMMNRKLNKAVETVFLTPKEKYSFLSSRLVREVCALGGSLEGLVHPLVERELIKKVTASTVDLK